MTGTLEKILCVEDDLDIQLVAGMSLSDIGGFTVEMCSSGQEALEKAPVFLPDMILLDVMMPGMDGPTTLKALRDIPEFENTPVVFMTAKVMGPEIEQYKEIGAIGVIPKPFDPMTLPDQIREIWEKHRGQ